MAISFGCSVGGLYGIIVAEGLSGAALTAPDTRSLKGLPVLGPWYSEGQYVCSMPNSSER